MTAGGAEDPSLTGTAARAIAEAFDLGEPQRWAFVARGAMGAVHRLTTHARDGERHWTVKRSFFDHYDNAAIAAEVAFTRTCVSAGVAAPRSMERSDGSGHVFELDDSQHGPTPRRAPAQVRVLEWVEGEVALVGEERSVRACAETLATVHRLALTTSAAVDSWYAEVSHDWADLAARLSRHDLDLGQTMTHALPDVMELSTLVEESPRANPVMAHRDIGADNLVFRRGSATVLDWENCGPLAPVQELACFVMSLAGDPMPGYRVYKDRGGPASISDLTDLACAAAVHLNFLGAQAELMLDRDRPEQHAFARGHVAACLRAPLTMRALEATTAALRR